MSRPARIRFTLEKKIGFASLYNMRICLVGSILRQTVITDHGEYSGWGGMTESAIAPFAALLDKNSTIYFVGNVGKEDLDELRRFFKDNYPIVNTDGIGINPGGTDHHRGTKHASRVKLKMDPTKYEQIKPFLKDVDVVIFNFGNIDDIDPAAIEAVRKNSDALIYVDVHRKPFGVDKDGYTYSRGWPNWEKYLQYADVVQMNRHECEALFQTKCDNMGSFIEKAELILASGRPSQVLITLGREGVLLVHKPASSNHEYLKAPAIPTNVVDVSGCGDAFAAGYLVALHEGRSLKKALAVGSLMGSINCEFMGYMRGLDRESIEKRIPPDFSCEQI